MKPKLILLLSFSSMLSVKVAHGSWFEFCHMDGEVVTEIAETTDNISFDFRVDSVRPYKLKKNGRTYPNYTDCGRFSGRVVKVEMLKIESYENRLYQGSIQCLDFSFTEIDVDKPIEWKLGCENN